MQRWAGHSSVKCIIAPNFGGQIICSTKRGGNKTEMAFILIGWTINNKPYRLSHKIILFPFYDFECESDKNHFGIQNHTIHCWLFFVSLSRYGTVTKKFWKFIPLVLIFGKIVLHSNELKKLYSIIVYRAIFTELLAVFTIAIKQDCKINVSMTASFTLMQF